MINDTDVNIQEVCFRNGEQNMKEKVINMLMDIKTHSGRHCYLNLIDIIKMVEDL